MIRDLLEMFGFYPGQWSDWDWLYYEPPIF